MRTARQALQVRLPPAAQRSLRTALLVAGALYLTQAAAAQGLRLNPDEGLQLRWQARLQLSTEAANAGSRLLSANLLGDYYLTRSLLGEHTRGGLRATGGLMLGSATLAQSSGGLALGNSSLALLQPVSVGQRSISLSPLHPFADSSVSMSYLGIGYTGQSLRGGWGFSADLGLLRSHERGSLRLGQTPGGGAHLDELLMDMRFRPVLQIGLSYSF